MTAVLVPVPPDKLAAAWPHVLPHIEKMARATRGKLSADDFRQRIAAGEFQLWVVLRDGNRLASVLTEIIQYPQRKVARIVGCVGRHREEWVHLLAEVQDWARSQGCVAMEAFARKGWARVIPDFHMTHIILETDL